MWVFDATPLLNLAETDRLDALDHLDDPCVLPERVRAGVIEAGLDAGYPDARRLERAVADGCLDAVSVDETPFFEHLRQNDRLSEADAAVIALADERDGTAVLDETYGRDVAATDDVPARGTASLVVRLARDDAIATTEGQAIIDELLEADWYGSPARYAKIRRKLEEMD